VTTWVALLRAVNVAGSGRLAMADLRRIAVRCGFAEPRTYIQSGNLVFRAAGDPGRVRRALADGLREDAGLDTAIVLRTRQQIQAVVARNPFPDADPRHLHVTFLLDPPGAGLDPDTLGRYAPESAILDGELYLHLPDGMGRSRLAADLARRPALAGTSRGWRTVTALAELARESG
jgi:uncharacterized protein (DUF1697 family)